MDELERLASVAEQEEQSEAEAAQSEVISKEVALVEPECSTLEASENRAESILKVIEGGIKLFVDSRIQLNDDDYKNGKESLGAVIDKYDLQGDGTGRIPLEEEVRAGFFIGALAKVIYRSKRMLNERDKKQQEQQEAASRGNQREHTTPEQTHAVSSEVGVRQDTDVAPPFRHS